MRYLGDCAWKITSARWSYCCSSSGVMSMTGTRYLVMRSKSSWRSMPRSSAAFPWEISHSIAFSGGVCHRSAKASRRENLEIEQPVACRDGASFDFHPTLPGMLGTLLIGHEVVQMCQPSEKHLLAPFGMMKAFQREQLPLNGVMGLIQQRAGDGHLRVFEHRKPACLLVLKPASHALAVGHPSRGGHVVSKVAQPLAERKHPQALALTTPVQ